MSSGVLQQQVLEWSGRKVSVQTHHQKIPVHQGTAHPPMKTLACGSWRAGDLPAQQQAYTKTKSPPAQDLDAHKEGHTCGRSKWEVSYNLSVKKRRHPYLSRLPLFLLSQAGERRWLLRSSAVPQRRGANSAARRARLPPGRSRAPLLPSDSHCLQPRLLPAQEALRCCRDTTNHSRFY